ncbi:hypothetical protein CASFOL_018678 [Castilleja foliolosa]|uniref:Zinc finger GRF-type domain-containing protein n=1 Tax=Castilleja foliolosa TaxID=1961234 RepID=A0ABD3D9D2_9LAMI
MSSQSTRRNQFPAQNGSGSRSSSSYGNAAVRCHCGIQLELVTSWTDDNPGRRFQACPNYKVALHPHQPRSHQEEAVAPSASTCLVATSHQAYLLQPLPPKTCLLPASTCHHSRQAYFPSIKRLPLRKAT